MEIHQTPEYSIEFGVRDYELDYEGIVNNAVYLQYLEHTRHQFGLAAGVDFAELHNMGIDCVVRRAEIDYYCPLRSNDVVVSRLRLSRRGVRFIFDQELIRKRDGNRVIHAVVTVVALKDGSVSRGDEIAEAFKDYLNAAR